jgi:hypothetical protein
MMLCSLPLQRPQEIDEKIQKKFFLGICTGPNDLFLDLKNFGAAFGATFKKKFFFKLRYYQVPNTGSSGNLNFDYLNDIKISYSHQLCCNFH